ncbi:DUF1273 domain-containing protein [Plantibacter sp. M259]|uniref:DUF1273 domain-containing protein n=1 Tax=Plantibacter sp. M259 TaxID=2583822 RepID=UPI001110A93E|nr:DUF1273 domain-containing protein [Plantibacter sp. M259]
MTRIGVTGHQDIPAQALPLITDGIRAFLAELPAPADGYSSLAGGADQLFARILLDSGGRLHAVIPASNYETTFEGDALRQYLRLLREAVSVEELPFDAPSEGAYDAAGHCVVDHSDILLAVWDGEPARGQGGTADAVNYARAQHLPVHIIWPAGVSR